MPSSSHTARVSNWCCTDASYSAYSRHHASWTTQAAASVANPQPCCPRTYRIAKDADPRVGRPGLGTVRWQAQADGADKIAGNAAANAQKIAATALEVGESLGNERLR